MIVCSAAAVSKSPSAPSPLSLQHFSSLPCCLLTSFFFFFNSEKSGRFTLAPPLSLPPSKFSSFPSAVNRGLHRGACYNDFHQGTQLSVNHSSVCVCVCACSLFVVQRRAGTFICMQTHTIPSWTWSIQQQTLWQGRFNGLFTYVITCSGILVWLSDIKINTHQCLAGISSQLFFFFISVIKYTDDYY